MAKILVEVTIPGGKYCKTCGYCKYIASDFAVCTLFDNAVVLEDEDEWAKRCDECRQAEVEDETES